MFSTLIFQWQCEGEFISPAIFSSAMSCSLVLSPSFISPSRGGVFDLNPRSFCPDFTQVVLGKYSPPSSVPVWLLKDTCLEPEEEGSSANARLYARLRSSIVCLSIDFYWHKPNLPILRSLDTTWAYCISGKYLCLSHIWAIQYSTLVLDQLSRLHEDCRTL